MRRNAKYDTRSRKTIKYGRAVANSVESNYQRRKHLSDVFDWDEAIARFLEMIEELYSKRG
jgi:hypothetical protein